MNRFKNWYIRNQDAITWFIIGWLSFALLQDIITGDWIWAAINTALIYANYKLRGIRLT